MSITDNRHQPIYRPHKIWWIDAIIIAGLAGILFGVLDLSHEWAQPKRYTAEIDLSPIALPQYTFFSLSRGVIAYIFSLVFTLFYGYWAAKDKRAGRVLIPLLDILQSVPVLGFMPGLVLALVYIFPYSNTGLELAAILMIFTGQAWNMTFSFYQSIRSVPEDLHEAGNVYRFSWWERLKCVELPFSTMGLVWNSMMSMAGGWFFLMINEAFVLGDKDFRLPGVGSYMSVAVAKGNIPAMLWAIFAMIAMILFLDQFLWRPIVVWAQKFRVEEGRNSEVMSSWVLNLLRRSRIYLRIRTLFSSISLPKEKVSFSGELFGETLFRSRLSRKPQKIEYPQSVTGDLHAAPLFINIASTGIFFILVALLGLGAIKLFSILYVVPLGDWKNICLAAFWTLGRVLCAIVIGTLWALPAGLAIGLSTRLSRILQPVAQIMASFPAPMLFPIVVAGLAAMGVSLGWGSIVLMLLGTQWYILFNCIAGAMAIPADLQEVAKSYRFTLWQRFRQVYLPAVFPYMVTGWVTAAGGAWNASIVSEYVAFKGKFLSAFGLGAQISHAAEKADFPGLAGAIVIMSIIVVLFNRTVWRYFYNLAESKFSISK